MSLVIYYMYNLFAPLPELIICVIFIILLVITYKNVYMYRKLIATRSFTMKEVPNFLGSLLLLLPMISGLLGYIIYRHGFSGRRIWYQQSLGVQEPASRPPPGKIFNGLISQSNTMSQTNMYEIHEHVAAKISSCSTS